MNLTAQRFAKYYKGYGVKGTDIILNWDILIVKAYDISE